MHFYGVLLVTNYVILYVSTISVKGDHLLLSATEKALFIITCIALFFLNTQWLIQTPIVVGLEMFTFFYFNEEIDEELEEHGNIEYVTLVIISILPLCIAAISYFIRKMLLLLYLENNENIYLRNEN